MAPSWLRLLREHAAAAAVRVPGVPGWGNFGSALNAQCSSCRDHVVECLAQPGGAGQREHVESAAACHTTNEPILLSAASTGLRAYPAYVCQRWQPAAAGGCMQCIAPAACMRGWQVPSTKGGKHTNPPCQY